MKILLMHISNTYNYGSMMMAENIIVYLLKNNPDIDFYIDSKSEDNVYRLKEATQFDRIFLDEMLPKHDSNMGKFSRIKKKFISSHKDFINTNKFYNKIIILGGDDFSELYYKLPIGNIFIYYDLKKLKKLNRNSKVVLIGQTIGPYTGIRKKWASKIFKDINIITRDEKNRKYLKDVLKVKSESSRDLAFLDLELQAKYLDAGILPKYNLSDGEYIVFVSSGLSSQYTKNEEDFLESTYNILVNLSKKYNDKKIVWLSHVVTPDANHSDNAILKKLNDRYNNYVNKNVTVIDKILLPVEARIILGKSYYVITCRMHAAVSALQMKKPAICLSYSPKYSGVIGEIADLVIEARGEEIWSKEIVNLVLEKVKYLEQNYDEIIKKIDVSVTKNKKIVLKSINKIL